MTALGVKAVAMHMSANDPKRTLLATDKPFRAPAQIATMWCVCPRGEL